jgi:hypothetical protein
MNFRVFWDILPSSQVDVDRRFRGAYCLHHQGDEWMMGTVRTSETSVNVYLTTLQYIPEDSGLQQWDCIYNFENVVTVLPFYRTTIIDIIIIIIYLLVFDFHQAIFFLLQNTLTKNWIQSNYVFIRLISGGKDPNKVTGLL